MAIQLARHIMQTPRLPRRALRQWSWDGQRNFWNTNSEAVPPGVLAPSVTLDRGTDWRRRCALEVAFLLAPMARNRAWSFSRLTSSCHASIDEERPRRGNLILDQTDQDRPLSYSRSSRDRSRMRGRLPGLVDFFGALFVSMRKAGATLRPPGAMQYGRPGIAQGGSGGRALRGIHRPIIGLGGIFDALHLHTVRLRDSTQIGLERPATAPVIRALLKRAFSARRWPADPCADIASKMLRAPSENSKDFRCIADYNEM